MFFYLANYIIVLTTSLISALHKRYQHLVAIFVFLILFFIAASRTSDVGRDYSAYVVSFERFLREDYFTLKNISFYEPAFFIFPAITKALVGPYYVFAVFTVFAFLGVYFKLKSSYLSSSFFLTAVLYVAIWFPLHEMTQVRTGIATGILLCSVKSIFDRQPLKYLLFVLSACLFHYSAILWLPLYFLSTRKISVKYYLAALLIAMAIAMLRLDIFSLPGIASLSPKLRLYSEMSRIGLNTDLNVWNIGFLLNLSATLVLLVKASAISPTNRYFPILLKINAISLLVFLLFSSLPVMALRIGELFGVVNMCLFPSLIYAFRQKLIGYAVVLVIASVNFYIVIFHSKLLNAYSVWWL